MSNRIILIHACFILYSHFKCMLNVLYNTDLKANMSIIKLYLVEIKNFSVCFYIKTYLHPTVNLLPVLCSYY